MASPIRVPIQRTVVPGASVHGHAQVGEDPASRGRTILVRPRPAIADYTELVRSSGVLCQRCQPTSHITVVCRILGIPIVTCDLSAMDLVDGDPLAIDMSAGEVVARGEPSPSYCDGYIPDAEQWLGAVPCFDSLRFQVSIIDSPELIDTINLDHAKHVDRFFLRSELLWLSVGRDPYEFLETEGAEVTVELLMTRLLSLADRLIDGQLLNFRGLDLRSDERADSGLPRESNPHLGNHGVRQLLQHPEYLKCELQAAINVAEQRKNQIVYSLPFLTIADEITQVREHLDALTPGSNLQIGAFLETPSSVVEFDRLTRSQIEAAYVGSKDLAQLLLAADRDNPAVAHLLSMSQPVVLNSIRSIIAHATESGIPAYVFAMPADIAMLLSEVPEVRRISLPAHDYIRLADLARRQ